VRQLYKQDIVGSLKQLTAFTGTEATNLTNVSGDGYTMYTSTALLLQARDIRGEAAVVLDTGDGVQWGITGRIRALDAAVRGLYYFDVSTQRKAKVSLELANDNVDRLGAATGEIGAGLSRLESAYRATRSKTTEFRSATDRIISADIAQSAAEATRQSVIQNVQASLLAQSSSLIPEIALQLLQSAAGQRN
jgi:flagellin-like hook-associated protein FlgL